jgi:hypothetical protein
VKRLRNLLVSLAAVALSMSCLAAEPATPAAAVPAQENPGALPAAPQPGPAKVCIDAESFDPLIKDFADRLRAAVTGSGALSLASGSDACALQFHIPGNLLRFQTASGVMVSAVAIVTSPEGRYLSTSIAACRESDLMPCAIRAVAVAKLALLLRAGEGT